MNQKSGFITDGSEKLEARFVEMDRACLTVLITNKELDKVYIEHPNKTIEVKSKCSVRNVSWQETNLHHAEG